MLRESIRKKAMPIMMYEIYINGISRVRACVTEKAIDRSSNATPR